MMALTFFQPIKPEENMKGIGETLRTGPAGYLYSVEGWYGYSGREFPPCFLSADILSVLPRN